MGKVNTFGSRIRATLANFAKESLDTIFQRRHEIAALTGEWREERTLRYEPERVTRSTLDAPAIVSGPQRD